MALPAAGAGALGKDESMRKFLESAIDAVKYAPWLTLKRLLRWGLVCALLSLAVLGCDSVAHRVGGAVNGRDFFGFWSSVVLAAAGRPDAAYAIGPFRTFEQSTMYPPTMMVLCWPLARLSYVPALLAWVLLGAALCAWSLSRLVGWRMAALATVGTPAAFWNLVSRQNGCFTAVLLFWGLSLIERRPVSAGILLGTLSFKPQLGLLMPVALAAGGHWRAFISATVWVALLVAASVLVLGPEAWISFFHRLDLQRQLIEVAALSWTRMPTVFAMMRLLGAGLAAAYVIQGVSAIAAALAVGALWHGRCPIGIKSAGLAIGIFLATSYIWDYDMVILVFAAAWFAGEAAKTGFQPWEKITTLVLLTLPAVSLGPAKLLGLQTAPILLWLAMAVVLHRGLALPRAKLFRTDQFASQRDGRLPV
jgi:arabinofuranan 3-O-arabinosyltransferase